MSRHSGRPPPTTNRVMWKKRPRPTSLVTSRRFWLICKGASTHSSKYSKDSWPSHWKFEKGGANETLWTVAQDAADSTRTVRCHDSGPGRLSDLEHRP